MFFFFFDFVPGNQRVERPDHPFLLRGPDVLVGGPDNLCAIFVPQAVELRNPAHLLARLISARLALPRFVRTVLMFKRPEEHRLSFLQSHFGLTTTETDPHLVQFLNSPNDFGNSEPMKPEIQSLSSQNFDLCMRVVRMAYRAERVLRRSSSDGRSIASMGHDRWRISTGEVRYSPRNRIVVEGVYASVLSGKTQSNLKRQLSAALTARLLSAYQLDRGVPYPVPHSGPELAIAANALDLFPLRGKEVYALAFSGISLLPTDDLSIVSEAASMYRTLTSGFDGSGEQ
ncbi:hypothetical protein [Rhodopseudomonas palustris]|uniref:hypothetical protein n=1 Tax=Rhodopseudomonas palustris TaxID=1076 RepID=UPI001058FF69|nr:hypothetical protein [Rhodopseudomonas palustris]QLH73013.1 hypothetical protein HZF03_20275 [Rhodopseudomonas palustris]